jgi:uncharacterized membrane protein
MTKSEPADAIVGQNEHHLLASLRQRRRQHRAVKPLVAAPPTTGERTADRVAAVVGSWRFILIQSFLLALWIAINSVAWYKGWDPYPFILLNLVLSFQAAYTAPIIMMSQNRAAVFDRQRAEDDYHINIKAELEIELLHQKVDLMREQEIVKLLGVVERLEKQLVELARLAAEDRRARL